MLNLARVGRSATSAAVRTALMTMGAVLLASSAVAQVQVTSLQGTATAGGSPLLLHSKVGTDLPLEISRGARCSLLLADRALVQICGASMASVSETRHGGGTIELGAGEMKAIAPDDARVSVQTPTARILLRGAGALITVAPRSGNTVVSALDGKLSVSRRDESDSMLLHDGQQVRVLRDQGPGQVRVVSRENLARDSACMNDGIEYRSALDSERALLIGGIPAVSAGAGSVTGHHTSDLQQIVKADFPKGGLPLEDSATPSALVIELSKRGADEEICDPITCNPIYRLSQPGPCGVPPVRPCTP